MSARSSSAPWLSELGLSPPPVHRVTVPEFLAATHFDGAVIDTRSPREFALGHMPGATNVPLFDDEERHEIGVLYKRVGRDAAMGRGLELVRPKLDRFEAQARALGRQGRIWVYCWRGGMRSRGMGDWLSAVGLETTVLVGGYKRYRTTVLEAFEAPYDLMVLSGRTGSGKTEVLAALAELGEQVVDLEGLAHHRGSAFGGLGQPPQPTVQQFENELHAVLWRCDRGRRIWVEDESSAIGRVPVPRSLWRRMQSLPVVFLDVPLPLRVRRLVREYAELPREGLRHSLDRIAKRLGGQRYRESTEALQRGDDERVAELTLAYYDKAYMHCVTKRPLPVALRLEVERDDPAATARALVRGLDGF